MTDREDELCPIIRRGGEDRDLDYKEASSWNDKDKHANCEIVKDILAMANTLGGYIVIGVSERTGHPEWEGLDAVQLKSWDTSKVNRFVQRYADPPINVLLRKPMCNGKHFLVLVVPQFSVLPHICTKDYPEVLTTPAFYVRTANNESAPVRNASELNDLIERAVQSRLDSHLSALAAVRRDEHGLTDRDHAACITASPGLIKGTGEIHIDFRNEGKVPARSIFVAFDTGHDFPVSQSSPQWEQMDPARHGHEERQFTVPFKISPPGQDANGNSIPNQRRDVWCRVKYRDDLDGWHNAYFLFRLSNTGLGGKMWNVTEEQSEANIPRVCRHTRPDASVRTSDEFNPAIPAVDPRDEFILDVSVQRLSEEPHASIQRRQLTSGGNLANRTESSIIKGLERLSKKNLITIEQRHDDGPARFRLEPSGIERALRRRFSDFNALERDVLARVCQRCPDPQSETTIEEISRETGLPEFVVEFIAKRLRHQGALRVRVFSDVVKVDHPDPRQCEELR